MFNKGDTIKSTINHKLCEVLEVRSNGYMVRLVGWDETIIRFIPFNIAGNYIIL